MEETIIKPRVVLCCPTRDRPSPMFLDSVEASYPLVDDAGYEFLFANEVGCPYISGARAKMIRRAMKKQADIFVFIDDDVSWDPQDLLTLIEAEGDVVGGTYRFKDEDDSKYMGVILVDEETRKPIVRGDGAVKAAKLPAGFLKVTKAGIERFMKAYPELVINAMDEDGGHFDSPDLFNHGAWHGVWFGEDYAFCRNWIEAGGEIWLLPNLNLTHNKMIRKPDGSIEWKPYPGNYHEFLLRCPGGAKDPARLQ